MFKYVDFLNEQLLVESNIIYSDKFKKVLSKMGLPLADTLLGIENKDYPVGSNYFDVSTTDSITFISDKRAKEIANQVRYRYDITGKFMLDKESLQYLWDGLGAERRTVDEPPVGILGTISSRTTSPKSQKVFVMFVPDDRRYQPIAVNIDALTETYPNDIDAIYWNNSRQNIRIGRGARALLNSAGIQSSDKEIEDFVNSYKATYDSLNNALFNFELVKGNDISYWYNGDHYYDGEFGTLGKSCMCRVAEDFFDIYCDNPEKISLLIYKSSEDSTKIMGRALVWLLNDNKIFMDRIYTHNDSDVELFRQYAKANGYYSKYNNNSSGDNCVYSPTGVIENLSLNVTLIASDYDSYPYMDTLKYYHRGNGAISYSKKRSMILLEETDGGYSGGCSNCNGDGTSECYTCEGSGTEPCDDCTRGRVSCNNCDVGVVDCTACGGDGKLGGEDCLNCEGDGEMPCGECDGVGTEICSSCEGHGTESCSSCDGEGEVDCDEC